MKESNTKRKSGTDWKRLERMTDEEIDVSDIPPLDEEFFKNATLRMPTKKKSVSLRLDSDILDWFKSEAPTRLIARRQNPQRPEPIS